jgi:hypothetical protein
VFSHGVNCMLSYGVCQAGEAIVDGKATSGRNRALGCYSNAGYRQPLSSRSFASQHLGLPLSQVLRLYECRIFPEPLLVTTPKLSLDAIVR